LNSIRNLTRFRWNLPVLAELKRSEGCKFITLVRRLSASDRAVRQSLDYLIGANWVARNPGYGHPSRPEYLLTGEGETIGAHAVRILDWLGPGRQGLATDRWGAPVLGSMAKTPLRFGELAELNDPISPRALATTLKQLVSMGLVRRIISEGFPPAAGYLLTEDGTPICGLLQVVSGRLASGPGRCTI